MKHFILLIFLSAAFMANAADKKITDLNLYAGASYATNAVLPIVDVTNNETKKTTIGDLDFRYAKNSSLASGTSTGLLSSTDWTTFNNKQATMSGNAPILVSGNSIAITQSSGSTNGYLSSTDWTTFNNKLSGTVPIANGGTGQTTNTAGFNALSPISSLGDLILGSGSSTASRLAIGANGYVLTSNGSTASWAIAAGGVSAWAASHVYAVGDLALYGNNIYRVATAHTSGSSIEADVTLGYWQLVQEMPNGPNRVLTGSNFEDNDTAGWQKFTISGYTAGTFPSVAPTLGSGASIATLAVSSSTPLDGKYSLQMASGSSVALAAGQGIISQAFNLFPADQTKKLTTSFDMSVYSGSSNGNFGATTSATWAPFIYDVTNSAWIGCDNAFPINAIKLRVNCDWQVPSNTTQFRIALLNLNNSGATGVTGIYLDDFFTGPQATPGYGPMDTDWVTYVPTLTGWTATSTDLQSRRQGSDLLIRGKIVIATVAASEARVSLGFNGVNGNVTSADTTKIATIQNAGYYFRSDNSTSHGGAVHIEPSVGYITFSAPETFSGTASDATAKANGNAITATGTIEINAKVPIQGWGSSAQVISSYDGRVVAAQLVATGALTTSAGAAVVFPATSFDSHGAYNASTGQYRLPVSGKYQVEISGIINAATNNSYKIYVYKNAAYYKTLTSNDGTNVWSGSSTLDGVAGDLITIVTDSPNGWAYAATQYIPQVSIYLIPGAQSIMTGHRTYAKYYVSAGGYSVTAGQAINFDVKEEDTTGSVTTGAANTWKFTAPATGDYEVESFLQNTTASATYFRVHKNGSATSPDTNAIAWHGAAASNVYGSTIIKLNAGDYISIAPSANATIYSAGPNSWITIKQVN